MNKYNHVSILGLVYETNRTYVEKFLLADCIAEVFYLFKSVLNIERVYDVPINYNS